MSGCWDTSGEGSSKMAVLNFSLKAATVEQRRSGTSGSDDCGKSDNCIGSHRNPDSGKHGHPGLPSGTARSPA
jgi:hypothetical protein